MPHLTTCTRCGLLYEEASEDAANEPAWTGNRLCPACYAVRRTERGLPPRSATPPIIERARALLRDAGLTPAFGPDADANRGGFVAGWWRDRDARVHLDVTHDSQRVTQTLAAAIAGADAIERALAPLANLPRVTITRSPTTVRVIEEPDMGAYIGHDHGFANEDRLA